MQTTNFLKIFSSKKEVNLCIVHFVLNFTIDFDRNSFLKAESTDAVNRFNKRNTV